MKKTTALLLLLSLVTSCRDDMIKVPVGFEVISNDGPSHFVYVHKEHLGDKMRQRDVAKTICSDIFQQQKYCEVYYFARKQDVPLKFPIVNRIYPIGLFQMKNNVQKFQVLANFEDNIDDDKDGNVVFFKNFYQRFYKNTQSKPQSRTKP